MRRTRDTQRQTRGEAAKAGPRLPALRQIVGDRQRANDRLRRSLWISILAHSLVFVALMPLALPRAELPTDDAPPPAPVELLALDPDALQAMAPPEISVPERRLAEDEDEPEQIAERSEPLEQPEDEPEPTPPPPERLEFVRAHGDALPGDAPDTHRISTRDQRFDQELSAPARARVAEGMSDRGVMAGSPQDAVQAGAEAQLPAPSTPLEREAQVQARQAASKPLPPRADRERDDEQPCSASAEAGGPCDALADASGARRARFDEGEPRWSEAFAVQSAAAHQAGAAGERAGWDPVAVRLPGLVPDAQIFPEAPEPDRASTPSAIAQERAERQHSASERQRDKERADPVEQRQEQAQSRREARAQGSSRPAEPTQPSELAERRVTPPEPELQFLVEPLELMRQEQERERRSKADERNDHKRRRRVAQGSARPSVASPTGSQAAAGGSVVSPIDPPPTLDVRTVLSARSHPLAGVLQALDDQLRSSWEIPFEIRVSGIVGTTGIELLLDRHGRVREVTTTRPSGHPQLDALARDAIPKRIEEFGTLLVGEARDEFPHDGLKVYYEFEYRDSPVAGVL